MLRGLIKFILVIIAFCIYLLIAETIWLLTPSPWRAHRRITRLVSLCGKLLIYLLDIKFELNKKTPLPLNRNYFIVGNHLSYLDVFLVSAIFPTCFVTSVEIKSTPILGTITRLAGCLFVERRNRNNLDHEVTEITNALEHGLSVCVFPEAKSSNGDDVLRFRRPLYMAAIKTQTPILPLCLNYKYINGSPVTKSNRDFLFWYGNMTFTPHFIKLVRLNRIEIELTILDPIPTSTGSDISSIAEISHAVVKQMYQPIANEVP